MTRRRFEGHQQLACEVAVALRIRVRQVILQVVQARHPIRGGQDVRRPGGSGRRLQCGHVVRDVRSLEPLRGERAEDHVLRIRGDLLVGVDGVDCRLLHLFRTRLREPGVVVGRLEDNDLGDLGCYRFHPVNAPVRLADAGVQESGTAGARYVREVASAARRPRSPIIRPGAGERVPHNGHRGQVRRGGNGRLGRLESRGLRCRLSGRFGAPVDRVAPDAGRRNGQPDQSCKTSTETARARLGVLQRSPPGSEVNANILRSFRPE
jgi:hypothetical protein